MSAPLVRRDAWWADAINMIALRGVHRKQPTVTIDEPPYRLLHIPDTSRSAALLHLARVARHLADGDPIAMSPIEAARLGYLGPTDGRVTMLFGHRVVVTPLWKEPTP